MRRLRDDRLALRSASGRRQQRQAGGRRAWPSIRKPGWSWASRPRGGNSCRDAAARSVGSTGTGDFDQTAIGADAEYSRAYYLIRFEAVRSTWTLPTIHEPLVRHAADGSKAAIRFIRASTPRRGSTIWGSARSPAPTRTADWEAPVTRIELGGGYLLQRNLQLKASFQRNTRDGGRVTHLKIGAAQLVFWF